jgi:hypothetical protein
MLHLVRDDETQVAVPRHEVLRVNQRDRRIRQKPRVRLRFYAAFDIGVLFRVELFDLIHKCGVPGSNRRLLLGKQSRYHYAKPAARGDGPNPEQRHRRHSKVTLKYQMSKNRDRGSGFFMREIDNRFPNGSL